jgi:hypothetical protein
MKSIIRISLFCLAIGSFQLAMAQTNTQPRTATGVDNNWNNSDIRDRSQRDLNSRYPGIDNEVVTWDHEDSRANTAYYRRDGRDYMSRYDAEGNWMETLERRDWNDNDIPDGVKQGYDNNNYKSRDIDSYWQVTESRDQNNRDGHLLFMRDKDGKNTNVRMDANGNVTSENEYTTPDRSWRK